MAKPNVSEKNLPHIAQRRIKWKGSNPPLYINAGGKTDDGEFVAVTMSHVEDAAYLTQRKRGTYRLATEDETKEATIYGS